MNQTDDRPKPRPRTVPAMRRFTFLIGGLGGLGAAGAAANARAELESAHLANLQAALVARRVAQCSGGAGVPLTPAPEARVA
ncbi:MAG: hypothetical protein JWM47_2727 [Acidimicrobiales bacterium]|nr:hypothetical protein [Acidimicrobiales bacterium]